MEAIKPINKKSASIASLFNIEIGENEDIDSLVVKMIKLEVEDLESRTLTQEQSQDLDKIKKDIELGNYSTALEKLLPLTQ